MGGLSRNCLINSKKGSIKHTETDPDTGWNTHQMLQASKGKKNTGTKKKKKKKQKKRRRKSIGIKAGLLKMFALLL